ncbi:MAG TPA: M81 family metallopeptidase, partial [Petrimonas sp.]|nr:M81 family metallopeptidase [Petrimonas sp.]
SFGYCMLMHGRVERSVFDNYKNEILNEVRNARKLDAIYLGMHGAEGNKVVVLKTLHSFVEIRDFKEAGLNPLDRNMTWLAK